MGEESFCIFWAEINLPYCRSLAKLSSWLWLSAGELTKDNALFPLVCTELPLPAPAERGEGEQAETLCVLLWGQADTGLQGLTQWNWGGRSHVAHFTTLCGGVAVLEEVLVEGKMVGRLAPCIQHAHKNCNLYFYLMVGFSCSTSSKLCVQGVGSKLPGNAIFLPLVYTK